MLCDIHERLPVMAATRLGFDESKILLRQIFKSQRLESNARPDGAALPFTQTHTHLRSLRASLQVLGYSVKQLEWADITEGRLCS